MAKTTKKTTTKAAAPDKKKPVRKKATAKKTTANKETVRKTTTKRKAAGGKAASVKKTAPAKPLRKKGAQRQITVEERHRLIAEAAYLRGEAQGFLSDDREDWLLAEAEIDARLTRAKVRVLG